MVSKSKDMGSLMAQRTLEVLLLFQEHTKLTLTEIARLLDLSITAVHRIVSTLHENGFLTRDETKSYMLGYTLMNLSRLVENTLQNVALQIMDEISKEAQESVYLSISHNPMQYILIQGVESPHPVKCLVELNKPIPTYFSSPGKAHLAFRNTKKLGEIVSKLDTATYNTNQTIHTKEEFMEELIKIRQEGYSFSKGELYEDSIGISVPVLDSSQKNEVAVLSIFMPEYRFSEEKLSQYVSLLKTAAKKIH